MKKTAGFLLSAAAVISVSMLAPLPVSADEVFVHNRPFKRAAYSEKTLYVPMQSFMEALRMHWTVNENGRVIFQKDFAGSCDAVPQTELFEAEYAGVVFRVQGIVRDGEVWIPVRLISERLGFQVKSNASTGIIDISAPRNISASDREAERMLKAKNEAKVKHAEEVLALRRAEKAERLKKEKEEQEAEAKKAAEKKAAQKKAPKAKKRAASNVSEGSFPEEFDDEDYESYSSSKISRPTDEDASPYPKAKKKAVKQEEPEEAEEPVYEAEIMPRPAAEPAVNKDGKAEGPDPDAEAMRAVREREKLKIVEAEAAEAVRAVSEAEPKKAFVSYISPFADVNYNDGSMKLSADICNRSEAEAADVSAVLTVFDSNGKFILSRTVQIGTVKPEEVKHITAQGQHPMRSSIPRSNYRLEVKLTWK